MNTDEDMWTKTKLERTSKLIHDTILLLERVIKFERWGFAQSHLHIAPDGPPYVIYDSQWCRVQFYLGGGAGDRYSGPTMTVYYGRLHAPSEESIIVYEGERAWCWHRVEVALNFLDGLSPQEAVDQKKVKRQYWPNVPTRFLETDIAKEISPGRHPSPELMARMHSVIWEYYGQSLFDVFDVNKPDLWKRYTQYVTEYCRIFGYFQNPGLPAKDKVC